ncbi:Uncharacterized protein APZ42_011162 [Daphnia magna]|uniref:Uncharacterized protein n=1 Tax=Daphnia magna TaxID=35525 RepID=A0A162T2D7_9CRUS|nr:Uncharacterized protein APZ42_011162 [Daphnia magna]
MASCDQSDEMAVPARASPSHGSTAAAQTSGYTSYFSVNGTDPDPNADVAGLNECSVLNSLPPRPSSHGHRQSAVALHQSSDGSPKSGEDNRLVMHVALLKQ